MDVYFQTSRPQMDIGYDVMATERCIEGGGVAFLEGDFDPKQVGASLERLGYDVAEYAGVATYHFNAERYAGDEVGRELAQAAGHVAVMKKGAVLAATVERLRAALDTLAGRADNLSNAPQYVALAEALGPAVSAVVFSRGGQLAAVGYQNYTLTEGEYVLQQRENPSCTSPGGQERYGGRWLGGSAKYEIRRIVLAATYTSVAEAEAEAGRLAQGVEAHAYADHWIWSGEPAIAESKSGATLVIVLELSDDAPEDILEQAMAAWPQILAAE